MTLLEQDVEFDHLLDVLMIDARRLMFFFSDQ
jgi:hypothetical protein